MSLASPETGSPEQVDPARSACVLIGVDAYRDLEELRSVRHNLDRLAAVLRDERIGGFTESAVHVVANPVSGLEITDAIHRAGELAADTLVVYYAGHGLIGRDDGLCLTLPDSRPRRPESWMDARDFQAAVEGSNAQRTVVILDCCFSGRYARRGTMSGDLVDVAVQSLTDEGKSFVLMSAPRDRAAHAPDPEQCSVFTGAMVKVLEQGQPGGPPMLTLDMIYERVRDAMKGVPEAQRPGSYDHNNLGGLGLVRNAARRPLPPPPPPPPTPRRRWPAALLGAVVGLAVGLGGPAVWPYLRQAPAAGDCSPYAALLGHSDDLDKLNLGTDEVAGLSGLSFVPGHYDRVYAVADNTKRLIFPIRIGPPDDLAPVAQDPRTLRGADGKPIGSWLDAEALAVERGGHTVLVASEDRPAIRRFDMATGQQVGPDFPVPDQLRAYSHGGAALAGRTFESLAVSPDGKHLYAGLEAPLAQDGDWHGRGLIRIERYTGAPGKEYRPDKQFVFLADEGLNLVDLAVLDDDRHLLALERQYSAGQGNAIRVRQIDLTHATNVAGKKTLYLQPSDLQTPSSLVFDLADCPAGGPGAVRKAGPQPNPLLGNVEGMALGPVLTGGPYRGRHLLLMVSDDNDNTDQITRLYAMAVKPVAPVKPDETDQKAESVKD